MVYYRPMTTITECLTAVAQAMHTDQAKCKAVLDEWIAREGLELDQRAYKRLFERVYVGHGADYPWRRLLDVDKRLPMKICLEWAQSKKRWSQK